MTKLIVLAEAERDFIDALRWYADRSRDVGLNFEAAVRSVFQLIAEAPERRPKISSRHRGKQLRRFPYFVVYRVLDDRFEIVAMAHTSRNGYWRRR